LINKYKKYKVITQLLALSGAIRQGKARGPKPRGIRPGKGPIAKGAHGQDSYFIFVINKYKKCKISSQLLALSGAISPGKARGSKPRGIRPGKGPIAKGAHGHDSYFIFVISK
jgi:hypothetical protein